jgi:hypothetical protein
VRRAREDVAHCRRQLAQELTERAVVFEVAVLLEPVVPGDGALDLDARRRKRDPVADRQRQPERVALDASVVEKRGADREPHHAAADGHGLETALPGHRVDQRARAREEMSAVVEPVVAAWVGLHAPAEARAGLQQQDVAVAQPPGGGQSGDPAAHDHRVARHSAMIGGGAPSR